MKATLTVNGNSIDIELNTKQYEKLFPEEKKRTGYEPVEYDEQYWYIDSAGNMSPDTTGWNLNWENSRYKNANYFSDEEVAENMARAQRLWSRIHRRAVELCEPVCASKEGILYQIVFLAMSKSVVPWARYDIRAFGAVWFDTEEHCQQVIEEFHDELLWYFTEFRDRADI